MTGKPADADPQLAGPAVVLPGAFRVGHELVSILGLCLIAALVLPC